MAQVRTGLANHGDGFFAMAQVKGKGQRGKTWVTEPGTNIILTLVMRPQGLLLQQPFKFSAAIALAVHDFFSFYAGSETTIKWPNDIYWRDRKAGGILIESVVANRASAADNQESLVLSPAPSDYRLPTDEYRLNERWAIIGTGININQTDFPPAIRNAVSLKQVTGKNWDVIELAKDLCGKIQYRYEQLLTDSSWLHAYNDRLYKKGQTVKFKKDSRIFTATVQEVDLQGRLVLKTAAEEYFGFGEIEWQLE